jgi:hypothetical protein
VARIIESRQFVAVKTDAAAGQKMDQQGRSCQVEEQRKTAGPRRIF